MLESKSSAAESVWLRPTVCHAMLSLVAGMEKVSLALRWPSWAGSQAGLAGLVNDLFISFVRVPRVSNISSVSKSPEMEMKEFSVV